MSLREFRGYLDAHARERHTEEAFLWGMHRNLVLANGRVMKEDDIRPYPDYEGPEEGQLPDDWEEAITASSFVRRVEVPQQGPSPGDVPEDSR